MKKCQIKNSETSEISYISEIFRVFLFPSFWFCTTANIENSDLKILEKIFWDFWVSWVFSLACFDIINSKHTFDAWTERAQSWIWWSNTIARCIMACSLTPIRCNSFWWSIITMRWYKAIVFTTTTMACFLTTRCNFHLSIITLW